jgi:hypothetical protein
MAFQLLLGCAFFRSESEQNSSHLQIDYDREAIKLRNHRGQRSKRGTDSDLLFVTEVFVLSDVKPVRVCEPWCSADCALPRSGNRQAPHK